MATPDRVRCCATRERLASWIVHAPPYLTRLRYDRDDGVATYGVSPQVLGPPPSTHLLTGIQERWNWKLRVVIVCHCFRAEDSVIRIISARKANTNEAAAYWS